MHGLCNSSWSTLEAVLPDLLVSHSSAGLIKCMCTHMHPPQKNLSSGSTRGRSWYWSLCVCVSYIFIQCTHESVIVTNKLTYTHEITHALSLLFGESVICYTIKHSYVSLLFSFSKWRTCGHIINKISFVVILLFIYLCIRRVDGLARTKGDNIFIKWKKKGWGKAEQRE